MRAPSQHPALCVTLAAPVYEPAVRFQRALGHEMRLPLEHRAPEVSDLAAAVEQAKEQGAQGLSIGSPFREDIMDLVDAVDPSAAEAGTSNAVVRGPEGYTAVNTLVDTLRTTLTKRRVRPTSHVIVHGDGMAAAAALAAARMHGVQHLSVVSRDAASGRELARRHGADWADASTPGAPVLINATPLGEDGPHAASLAFYPETVEAARLVVDLAVGLDATPLVRLAEDGGVRAVLGTSVLAHQWTSQFRRYTGRSPHAWHVARALRVAFSEGTTAPRGRRGKTSAPSR